jgi:hypothetical protein
MSDHLDQEIQRRLAPLAEHEPRSAEVAALRVRAGHGPRRRRRIALAAVAACVTAAAVLAIAPRGGEPGKPAPLAFSAFATVAERQPVPPIRLAPFRYTRTRQSFIYEVHRGDRTGQKITRYDVRTWVSSRWRGRQTSVLEAYFLAGDRALAERQWGEHMYDEVDGKNFAEVGTGTRAYAYGDGPLARLDPRMLPEERDRLAAVLREGIRADRWGPYAESRGRGLDMPEDLLRATIARSMIHLLVYARLSADQRAALMDVLAEEEATRDLGTTKDPIGRPGRGIALDFPVRDREGNLRDERYRVIFDPSTAEILAWTEEHHGGTSPWSPRREEIVLETGWAELEGGPLISN